jgi:hypothetical protein
MVEWIVFLALLPSLSEFPEEADAAAMLLRWSLLREIWIRGVPDEFEWLDGMTKQNECGNQWE